MIYVNNLSPFLFRANVYGHEFGVRWYGLAYVLGFALAYVAYALAISRQELPGAERKLLDRLTWAVTVGVLVGGRMGYVVQNLDHWAHDPLFPIKIWEGGMAFFGGLAGVILALAWEARKARLPFLSLTDVIAPASMLALAIGRLANFANKELWGRPTHSDWGVIYPNIDRLPRHPSELYESASHLFAFLLLLWVAHRLRARPVRPVGLLSSLFLILYGLLRTFTDFWREEPMVGVLNAGQWASLVVAALGLVLGLFVLARESRSVSTAKG